MHDAMAQLVDSSIVRLHTAQCADNMQLCVKLTAADTVSTFTAQSHSIHHWLDLVSESKLDWGYCHWQLGTSTFWEFMAFIDGGSANIQVFRSVKRLDVTVNDIRIFNQHVDSVRTQVVEFPPDSISPHSKGTTFVIQQTAVIATSAAESKAATRSWMEHHGITLHKLQRRYDLGWVDPPIGWVGLSSKFLIWDGLCQTVTCGCVASNCMSKSNVDICMVWVRFGYENWPTSMSALGHVEHADYYTVSDAWYCGFTLLDFTAIAFSPLSRYYRDDCNIILKTLEVLTSWRPQYLTELITICTIHGAHFPLAIKICSVTRRLTWHWPNVLFVMPRLHFATVSHKRLTLT